MKVTIREDFYGSIRDLYDEVAKLANIDTKGKIYDCRYIEVSLNIEERVEDYFRYEMKFSPSEFGMLWLASGPKCNELLDDWVVEFDETKFVR